MKTFYSSGKLLLTAEYLILDGAVGLALPTVFGQFLKVESIEKPHLKWRSLDKDNNVWFEDSISFLELKNSEVINDSEAIKTRLIQIFKAVNTLNPDFLNDDRGFKITTTLEFPRNWGLGTSSTLINNIAQWASVDAFKLLKLTFGGSGYDIACAQHKKALTYQLQSKQPIVNTVLFNPSFKNQLFFVYLNKKQNSRDGIKTYKSQANHVNEAILECNRITEQLLLCDNITAFEVLVKTHEQLISALIKRPTIQDELFNDYKGAVKSLGAWGGDFILVTGTENDKTYFLEKGYSTIIPYDDMILSQS